MKKELFRLLSLALVSASIPLGAATYKGEQYSVAVTSDGLLEKIMLGSREFFAEEIVSGAFLRPENGKDVLARIFMRTDYKRNAKIEKKTDGWTISKTGQLTEMGKTEPLVDFEFTKILMPRSIQLNYRFVQKTALCYDRPIFGGAFRQKIDAFTGIALKSTSNAGTQYTVFPPEFTGKFSVASGRSIRFSGQNGKITITVPGEQQISIVDGRSWKESNVYVNMTPSSKNIAKGKQIFPAGTVWEWNCSIQFE